MNKLCADLGNYFSCQILAKMRRFLFFLYLPCLLAVAFATPSLAQQAGKRQVVFLPFEIEVSGTYNHLRNGLPSMLASRLAARANIAAIAHDGATAQMAQDLKSGAYASLVRQLQQARAEYLIIGSLHKKDLGMDLHVYVFSSKGGETPQHFNQNLAHIDDAANAVDMLSREIAATVFGVSRPAVAAEVSATSGSETRAFQNAHPERSYREGRFTRMISGLENAGLFELLSTYRSKAIDEEIIDINVADLDNNGVEEILLLTTGKLLIYRQNEEKIRMLATVDLPNYLRYHALSALDLDGNGLKEIFIAASNDQRPHSMVLEWDGDKVTWIFKKLNAYLRAVDVPGVGPALFGQSYPGDKRFGDGIYQVQSLDDEQGMVKGEQLGNQLHLPKGINLFDFTLADITGDGALNVIAIDQHHRLQVYGRDGTLLWSGSEIYGASNNFYGSISDTTGDDMQLIYLKTRILVRDIDKDGALELVVVRNRLETVMLMPNLRYFDGASIVALKWEWGGLTPLWETRKIPGYIVNCQFSDTDIHSDHFTVYFAESGTSYPFAFWQSPASYINSYTLRVRR